MAEITLLVPCYNAVRYLPRLLESVAAQTEPFAASLFYDDGSTDGTADFLRARGLAVIGDRTNRGPAYARNRLLAAARGPWIHFHDADDLLEPAFVARMSELLTPQVDVAVCQCDWVNEDDRRLEIAWRPDAEQLARDPVESNLLQPCPLMACVIRLSLLREV
ncbi:MAG TPA: glycosyltransferase family A protein, partial [Opitutaceae bacterium]|nr:glycosyltransferase family A protein [Opitutaceae bacterium]